MTIVVAVYEPPPWVIPAAEVDRLAAQLPLDAVVHVTSHEALLAALPEADVLFATRIRADEFRVARRLRWIHSSAVGVGHLLFPELVASGVVVTNARGVHAAPIAEHAIALLLAVRRGVHTAARRQTERVWAQEEIYERVVPALADSTLLVVGLGAIGSRVAALAAGVGMRVIGVRKHPELPAPPCVRAVYPPNRLLDLLPEADAVVLALPHTSESRSLMGRTELARMKPHSVLVNVARGRLIDDAALVAALEAGRIGGAALDAFDREPLPPDHPFWRQANVLITPHTASYAGPDYWRVATAFFVENLDRLRHGQPLVNVVDTHRGY